MKKIVLVLGVGVLALSGCSTAQQHAQWDAECVANPNQMSAWCTPLAYDDIWDEEDNDFVRVW